MYSIIDAVKLLHRTITTNLKDVYYHYIQPCFSIFLWVGL